MTFYCRIAKSLITIDLQMSLDRRVILEPMTHIKAYTEDLDNNITFEYDVADRDVARLVAELKRENLTVEVESK